MAQRHERPMQRIGVTTRDPTPTEHDAIEEIQSMATEFAAGRLPIEEVRRLSTGERRWLATRFTPRDHPAFRPLMATLDALISTDPSTSRVYPTKHGTYFQDDLRDAEATVRRDDGREVLEFPDVYPWSHKPDAERGIEGIRAPALFTWKSRRGPKIGTFRVVPDLKPREKEWWE